MTARISSQRYAVEDFQEALDLCYRRGWTDGLPVVPPTEPSVRAMLDAVGLEPDAQIAFITNRQVAITAEKVAINAVMAGCLLAHMSVVVAENEGESPWTPLHVERGCRPEDSAVTVMAALAPHQFYNQLSSTAAGVLSTLCDAMRNPGMAGQPHYCVVLAGEHMRTIAAEGWSKADIRKFVFENSKNSVAHFKRTARMPGAIKPEDESTMRPL